MTTWVLETPVFPESGPHKRWRWEYNHLPPQGSLGYRPPAPEAWLPADQAVRAAL